MTSEPPMFRFFVFSCCKYWDLSIYLSIFYVTVKLSIRHFNIVCLSETLLDSTKPHNDENININGYSLLRVDHPNHIKRGGILTSMYFKKSLPLR